MTTKIGFLIIGAQKGGTTSLFEYVKRHPQIHMPVEKDIAFFNRDANFRRGWDWYVSTVTRDAPDDAVCGEASTYYMAGTPNGDVVANENGEAPPAPSGSDALEDVVPRRIRESLPDVRLVCVLRDPVARAYSHHRMMTLERAESRPFEQAMADALQPQALEEARVTPTRTNNYVVNGEYGRVLAGFLRVFPREQLLAITSNQLAEQPAETLHALYEFVGVDAEFEPDNLGTRYRQAAVKERVRGLSLDRLQMRLAQTRPMRGFWRALPEGLRDRIDRRYRVANYRVGMWNARRDGAEEEMSPAVRRTLIEHFLSDSEGLGEMLGQDIPWLVSWRHS